ncbi:phosphatase PAP2 family protein [Halomonas sp. THAF12]|uniref:Membrane-associated PAP2 superfamily phosphatase n=1 Tax=Halomonas organivorans TaxID=257772 RepID=A0A7W5BZX6_9GAMM|nr:phosphatase PAP2 family protein [Halomonas organivorans]MBB3141909.1 membrane-associated PAP2 superfamily phosphatase [Halomonas organivorans]
MPTSLPPSRLSVFWPRLLLAWAGFAALMLAFARLGLDFRLADFFYRLEGGEWSLRHGALTEALLHEGGRDLSQAMGGAVILALALSHGLAPLRPWRRPLWFLFLAVAGSTLAVSTLKQLVSMECPWDLTRYGGWAPFIGLFEARPAGFPDTACFPAGHASAGYAWVALFPFLTAVQPRWRWWGLAVGLGLGLVFGVAQQLRGAHFLSHDLWTLMLCTTISAVAAHWLLSGRPVTSLTLAETPA